MTETTEAKGKKPATRRALILRMQRMLERQIAHMEANMTGDNDKEVALLGNMVKTLEKLMELEAKQATRPAGKSTDAKRARDMTALRKKIADRIDELRKAQ